MPEIRELIREGKGKRVYATDNPDEAVVYFKDEAMAYHGLKRGRIVGKGEVNNAVCRYIFTLLSRHGIENHFIRQLDSRQSLIRRVEILPFSVTVRNRVAGSLADRLGQRVGLSLHPPVIEFTMKDTDAEDPLINETHMIALGMATHHEVMEIQRISLKVNEILVAFFQEINVALVDFKLEFGRWHGKLLLADEISPDSARLWEASTHEPLGIDRFRRDMDQVEQAYQELLHRMMGLEETCADTSPS